MLDIHLKFMPQDGKLWRIDWFGNIQHRSHQSRRTMPYITVELSTVDKKKPTEHRQIYALVAFLPKLKIGDIWRNGRLIDSPPYSVETFPNVTINRGATSIIKAGLSTPVNGHDTFYLPLAQHPGHAAHTQSYCLKVELADNKRLIIPAVELVRFYFGSSSNLIALLFRFPLMPHNLWSDATLGAGRKKATITLAQGISGWSAADVARMAFDPIALHAAQLVSNSLSTAKTDRRPLYPKAHFPFDGLTTLRASGVWLQFGNTPNRTFLVYKLLNCSHSFPFKGLEYTLSKRPGISGDGSLSPAPASTGSSSPQTLPVPAKRVSKNFTDEAPSCNLSPAEAVIDESRPFTDLYFKSVRKVAEISASPVQHFRIPGKAVSASTVGSGDDNDKDGIRPVDLVRRPGSMVPMVPSELMERLAYELGESGRIGKVEMLHVAYDDETRVGEAFGKALRRHNGGSINQASEEQLPELSDIHIAVSNNRQAKVYLFMGAMKSQPALSPLGIAIMPRKSKRVRSLEEEVTTLLGALTSYYKNASSGQASSLHFIPIPRILKESDVSRTVQLLTNQVLIFL